MRFFAIASVFFVAAVGVFANPIVQRDDVQSAAVILTNLRDIVMPLADQLRYATPENATEGNLKSVINKMSSSVSDAVSNLKHLSDKPATVILASLDEADVLSPSDIADLLGGIVNLIFTAAQAVLQVVDSAIASLIQDLLAELGQVVFGLISALLPVVAGLLIPLLPLLEPILSIVSSLGLTDILSSILGGLL